MFGDQILVAAYPGVLHALIWEYAMRHGLFGSDLRTVTDGFVDQTGKFLEREDAFAYLKEHCALSPEEHDALASMDEGSYEFPSLETESYENFLDRRSAE